MHLKSRLQRQPFCWKPSLFIRYLFTPVEPNRLRGWLQLPWQHIVNSHATAYIDGLVQGCSNSIANALELLQSCNEPSNYKRNGSLYFLWLTISTTYVIYVSRNDVKCGYVLDVLNNSTRGLHLYLFTTSDGYLAICMLSSRRSESSIKSSWRW